MTNATDIQVEVLIEQLLATKKSGNKMYLRSIQSTYSDILHGYAQYRYVVEIVEDTSK